MKTLQALYAFILGNVFRHQIFLIPKLNSVSMMHDETTLLKISTDFLNINSNDLFVLGLDISADVNFWSWFSSSIYSRIACLPETGTHLKLTQERKNVMEGFGLSCGT